MTSNLLRCIFHVCWYICFECNENMRLCVVSIPTSTNICWAFYSFYIFRLLTTHTRHFTFQWFSLFFLSFKPLTLFWWDLSHVTCKLFRHKNENNWKLRLILIHVLIWSIKLKILLFQKSDRNLLLPLTRFLLML